MPFVLDASIVGCWCFYDEHDVRADAAWDLLELRGESALVPIHWWFEVRNVLLYGERKGRITEDYSVQFLQRVERFAIGQDLLPDQLAVFALARKHGLTFYDAVYLELARREGLAIATLDDEIVKAARAEALTLISPS